MITYNNIVAAFQRFTDNHLILKRFNEGDLSTSDLSKEGNYPVLHIAPDSLGVNTVNQTTIVITIFDLPRDKDEFSKSDYQREVISDCAQIMNDIIADITNGGNIFLFDDLWSVELPVSVTPFIQAQQHVVAGVQASVTINVPWGIDACNLPLIPVTPPSPVVCLDATVNVNGNLFDTVASGGTLDVLVEYQNGTPVGTITGDTVVIPNPSVCADATFELNGTEVGTAASGGTLDVPVEYASGATVGSLIAGVWTIPDPTCADANIENSDDTYSDTVASGATLVLPNIDVTDQNGTVTTYPSVKDIDIRNYRSGILYSRIGYKYDQYTSYYAGDAGINRQNGVYTYSPPRFPLSLARLNPAAGVNMYNTLIDNSVAGTTARITAEGANTSIDELTGLQWYEGPIYTATSWEDALDYLAGTVNAGAGTAGYTDWRMPTVEEWTDIMIGETTTPGFVIPGMLNTQIYWTSNTNPNSTTQAFRISTTYIIAAAAKSTVNTRLCLVRTKRT